MGDVYFCATDYYLNGGYRSYTDFFMLAELAGYPIIPVKDIDPQSDNTYIFTPSNGEVVTGWPDAKATIILWQLEWMLTDEHRTPPGVKRVWASDAWFAKQQGFEYVPLGSDRRLNMVDSGAVLPKTFDVAVISYQTPRRQAITSQLLNEGLHLAPTHNLWARMRSVALVQSRTMVHVHQHDKIATVAPLRWCLAAAHELPVISETVHDRGVFGCGAMVQADYSFLSSFTKQMLQDARMLADYAQALHQLLCVEHTFRKVVDAHV